MDGAIPQQRQCHASVYRTEEPKWARQKAGSWRVDSAVKRTWCSCRGPGFSSQHPHMVAHNCPLTPVPGKLVPSSGLHRNHTQRMLMYTQANPIKYSLNTGAHSFSRVSTTLLCCETLRQVNWKESPRMLVGKALVSSWVSYPMSSLSFQIQWCLLV